MVLGLSTNQCNICGEVTVSKLDGGCLAKACLCLVKPLEDGKAKLIDEHLFRPIIPPFHWALSCDGVHTAGIEFMNGSVSINPFSVHCFIAACTACLAPN